MTLVKRRRSWRRLGGAPRGDPAVACAALLGVLAGRLRQVPAWARPWARPRGLDLGQRRRAAAFAGAAPARPGDRVEVSSTSHGVPSIRAASPPRLSWPSATCRPPPAAQMDLERRLGEGRLAQLAGRAAVSSDRSSCASAWSAPPSRNRRNSPGPARPPRPCSPSPGGSTTDWPRSAATGSGPRCSRSAGCSPAPGRRWTAWSPGGSDPAAGLTRSPLDYALLERALGVKRTMTWFRSCRRTSAPLRSRPLPQGGLVPLQAHESRQRPQRKRPRRISPAPRSGTAAGRRRAAHGVRALAQVGALPPGRSSHTRAATPGRPTARRVAAGPRWPGPATAADVPSVWYEVALSARATRSAG